MEVCVRTLTGAEYILQVEPTCRIDCFKWKIFEKSDVPPDQQRLMFHGRQLEDHLTLQDYKIEHK